MTHGRPRPRNTFTELEPVMFPIAESAYLEVWAAVLLAKVSGRDVPRATMVIALIEAGSPMEHPNIVATCSTMAVMNPIMMRATRNDATPP